MKLSNIESKQLLPRFAGNISWVMDALDQLIKETAQRVKSIDAPLTMESIEACTDAELEALYDQYGVAQYYPDLSRQTRNKMLYEMCRIYRYLGTPHAIEVLCNYIFDGVRLNVKVEDNLAFDENGDLVDESLLDVFDVDVNPTEPIFGADVNARIIANIIRFSRNSQALRSIVYTFIQDFALSISPCKRTGNPQSTQTWPQDSLCVPYTPPTPAYTEITLYIQSGYKSIQTQITSGFTGNVNSSYVYPLYEDENLTIPWAGYDYSNDYQVGYIGSLDGEWHRRIDSISDLPDTTVSEGVRLAFVLLDNGAIWLCSNSSYSSSSSPVSGVVVLRIYSKAQQQYPLYFNYNNLYGNYSLGANRPGYPWPSGTSGNYMAWFASYPVPSVVKFLGSAGNEFLQGGDVGAIAIRNNSSNALEITRIGYTNNISVRCAIFTLDSPTLFAWTMTDKTNRSISSGAVCILYDENGNGIAYDDLYSYKILGILQASGANCSSERNVIQYASMISFSSVLAFKQTYGTISAAKIWYIKEQRNIIVNFGDPVTIPDGFTVDSVKCTKLFIKPGEISYSGHVIYFEYLGANVYSNDTDLSLFGVGVNPCIEMFGFSNASTFAGFRLSVDFSRTGYATAVSASKLNADGYFVKGEATLSSSYTTSNYVGHMQANPMMFRLYINGAVKSYHFNVPQSVWQYQNGVFSWLGNDTDATDLAYWYKSAPDIQINLRPIT